MAKRFDVWLVAKFESIKENSASNSGQWGRFYWVSLQNS